MISMQNDLSPIPAMTTPVVRRQLRQVGSRWSGKGAAVECGCWLGAGTIELAKGLREAGYDRKLYCYDRWQVDTGQVGKAKAGGVSLSVGQDLLPAFLENMRPSGLEVDARQGELESAIWHGEPIEVFVLDAAKAVEPFFWVLSAFGSSWIPDVTTIAFLDLSFAKGIRGPKARVFRHQQLFVDLNPGVFEPLEDYPGSVPAFYRYRGGMDSLDLDEMYRRCVPDNSWIRRLLNRLPG